LLKEDMSALIANRTMNEENWHKFKVSNDFCVNPIRDFESYMDIIRSIVDFVDHHAIFSGLGSAVIAALLSLFLRQRSQASNAVAQRQRAGHHSNNVQIGNIKSDYPPQRKATN
jgi:hypothetical protein